MGKIQQQLAKVDACSRVFESNIQRLSVVTERMRDNARRCRISSIMVWKDKAEYLLNNFEHAK